MENHTRKHATAGETAMSETIAPDLEAPDQNGVESASWDNEGGALAGADPNLKGVVRTARSKRRKADAGHRPAATARKQTLWST